MKKSIPLSKLAMLLVLVLAGVPAYSVYAQATVVERVTGYHWVGTWASSAQEVERKLMPPDFPSLEDTTVRQVVHVSIGGERLRVRFSNAFADWRDDLTISTACIADSAGGSAINPETNKPLTFHGQSSVGIPYGTLMISDPIDFDLAPGSDLVVTIHVSRAPKKVTGHRSARGEVVFIQAGNAVTKADLPQAAKNKCWCYLCGVEVLAPSNSAAAVCLGDSITDGKGSTEGENRRWPDYLARRLLANQETADVGMLNQGIGGNGLWQGGIGQTAMQRLDRDVLAQPAVRWVLVLEGINDLGGGRTSAEELIVAYEQIIMRAHDQGLRVYGGTILPCGGSFYFKPGLEEKRQAINHWIRSSGAFDAVVDWDAALRDPQEPTRLLEAADSGDHLHPSDVGHRMIADAVDLTLFSQ